MHVFGVFVGLRSMGLVGMVSTCRRVSGMHWDKPGGACLWDNLGGDTEMLAVNVVVGKRR